jgi:hypothetical protein
LDKINPWKAFRIGTCEGLFRAGFYCLEILAIINSEPGNGHFNDVLQWFEYGCKTNDADLKILEVWNENFLTHLIEKRGFELFGEDNVVKKFI